MNYDDMSDLSPILPGATSSKIPMVQGAYVTRTLVAVLLAGGIFLCATNGTADTLHDPILCFASATANTDAKPTVKLDQYAPADRYFGRFKMSIIAIRNTMRELAMRSEVNRDNMSAVFGKALLAEASLKDWEKKYPRDPELPRYMCSLTHLYQKMNINAARVKSVETRKWLLSNYPATKFAQDEQRRVTEVSDIASPAPQDAQASPAPQNAQASPAPQNAPASPAPQNAQASPAPQDAQASPTASSVP